MTGSHSRGNCVQGVRPVGKMPQLSKGVTWWRQDVSASPCPHDILPNRLGGSQPIGRAVRAPVPPTQVGVWIPKAKQGPTADFFRPLGMPDTLDRLQDGTAAAILFRITRHSFHPAQTLLNSFREPQRAVREVQGALEGSTPASALFADLSKAFERINAHWILHILREAYLPTVMYIHDNASCLPCPNVLEDLPYPLWVLLVSNNSSIINIASDNKNPWDLI